MAIYAPLEHYVYPKLDVECGCALCVDWRAKRAAFDEYKALTFDHNRSCMCWRCRRRRGLQQAFLAASSKRELYCEMSWHASRHAGSYGTRLMDFVATELRNDKNSNGWWATLGQAYTLSYWLSKFQSALFPDGKPKERHPLPNGAWCRWCGNDLFNGHADFCSSICEADYQADIQMRDKRPRRRYLPGTGPVSGFVSLAVSGVVL